MNKDKFYRDGTLIYSKRTNDYTGLPFLRADLSTASKERREDGLWQICESKGLCRLYVTCPYCGVIIDATRHPVLPDGSFYGGQMINNCVTCRDCTAHFWPVLKGITVEEIGGIGQRPRKEGGL